MTGVGPVTLRQIGARRKRNENGWIFKDNNSG